MFIWTYEYDTLYIVVVIILFIHVGVGTDCIRCHDCYFKWQLVLQGIKTDVTALMDRIDDSLLYYGNYNVQNVLIVIANITDQLQSTMAILSTISIDSTEIETIETTLAEVSTFSLTNFQLSL